MHLPLHLPPLQPLESPHTHTRILPLRRDSMIEHFLVLKQNAKVSALQLPRTLVRIPTLARMALHLQNVHQRLLEVLVQENAAHLPPLHRLDLDNLLLLSRILLGNEYLSPVHCLCLEMTHLTM